MRAVTTPSDSSPRSIDCSCQSDRLSSPAETRTTTANAICAAAITWSRRPVPLEGSPERCARKPRSLIARVCHAGAVPKASTHAVIATTANAMTPAPSDASSMRGTCPGSTTVVRASSPRPSISAPPPAAAPRTSASITVCLRSCPRVAPSAERTAISTRRDSARMSSRMATLAPATRNTSAAPASRSARMGRTWPMTVSSSGVATTGIRG